MATMNSDQEEYDRLKEVKNFDDSKIGIKGLPDSGLISFIPRFFHHPPESRPTTTTAAVLVPIIDLSGPHSAVVDQVRSAASTFGFFQITNYGIPSAVLRRTVAAVKSFNEQPTESKMAHYHRETSSGVNFSANVDLFCSKAASWRDTIQMRLAPTPPNPEDVPEVVRSEVYEWDREIGRLGDDLGIERENCRARRQGQWRLTTIRTVRSQI